MKNSKESKPVIFRRKRPTKITAEGLIKASFKPWYKFYEPVSSKDALEFCQPLLSAKAAKPDTKEKH